MSLYQSYVYYQNSDYLNNYQNEKQELIYQHQAPAPYTEVIQQETKR
ncbi:unnamed protein product, partial [Brachionus calyciflorus]